MVVVCSNTPAPIGMGMHKHVKTFFPTLLAGSCQWCFVLLKYDVNLLVKMHSRILHRSDYGPPPVGGTMHSSQEVRFTKLPVERTSVAEPGVQLTIVPLGAPKCLSQYLCNQEFPYFPIHASVGQRWMF
jgi:hypothetical protein